MCFYCRKIKKNCLEGHLTVETFIGLLFIFAKKDKPLHWPINTFLATRSGLIWLQSVGYSDGSHERICLNKITLKGPRKKMHLKMSSAEIVCCKKLPNITDEIRIDANSVDPEQTAPIGAV